MARKKRKTTSPILTPDRQRVPYPEVLPDHEQGIIDPIGSINAGSSYNPSLVTPPSPQPVGGAASPPVNNTQPTAPITNFSQTAAGQAYAAQQAMQIPVQGAQMQSAAPGASQFGFPAPIAAPTMKPQDLKLLGYAGPAMAGLSAGTNITPTTSAEGAVLQTAGAGLSGAAGGLMSGAMIGAAGGPIGAGTGALIGGLVGLVSGGLSSYFGTKQARDAQRKQDRAAREARAFQEKWNEQNRQDQLYMFNTNRQDQLNQASTSRGDNMEQLRYNRKQAAIQSQWAAMDRAREMVNGMMQQDMQFKNAFIQQER